METTIRKWSNSPAVRLPAAVLREAEFGVEQRVNISASQGRIVIEPSGRVNVKQQDWLRVISSAASQSIASP